jgi:CRISPR system Cascade subunit CasE
MYLSRIRLRPDAAGKSEFWRNFGSEYQAHRQIWELFTDGPDRKRDFLYRQETFGSMPTFYAVSEREPVNRGGLWHIESKIYEPVLREGQRLAFVLRANPIRTKCDEKGRHKRHDVVMDVKTRLKQQGRPRASWPLEPEIVQRAGFAWLATRGEQCGFDVRDGEVRADGYRQQRFFKQGKSKPIQFSTIDYTGLLTVIEPEAFLVALFNGIGPAKGFGCGMMMVRPTGR